MFNYETRRCNCFYIEMGLNYVANRIWEETDTGIIFVKNRYKEPHRLTEEEMEEFFWVKLKAIPY